MNWNTRIRIAGFVVLVLALAAAVFGTTMQRDANDQAASLRALHPLKLAGASTGDRGYLDATVGTPAKQTRGPVSLEPAAYWEVTRTRHWDQYEKCATHTHSGSCQDGWEEESERVSRDRSGDELPIRADGERALVTISGFGKVKDMRTLSSIQHDDPDSDVGSEYGPSIGARQYSMIESVERGLRSGDRVLVLAKVAGTSSSPRLVAIDGLPVAVADTTFRGHIAELNRTAATFGYLLDAGIAGAVLGFVLLGFGFVRRII